MKTVFADLIIDAAGINSIDITAAERLEKDFPTTHTLFKKMCENEKDEKHCLNEMVEDHMMDWYEGMMNRVKRWK